MKDMDRTEIIAKLSEIKAKGFVPTMRQGTTGVGYTLEQLFEIDENNIALPNLKDTELKAKREQSAYPITILTYDRCAWGGRGSQLSALEKYGYSDSDGRLGMYHLLKTKANSHGLFLSVSDTEVSAQHTDGTSIAKWSLKELAKKLDKKTKNILLVNAKVDVRNGVEHFLYDHARWCHNGIDYSNLRNLFENEKLMIDLRLHKKLNGSVRNHGTGFRIYENNLPDMYQTIEELSF
jgi:hypothetical protein